MSLIGGMLGSMWDSLFYDSSASKSASDDAYEKQLSLMRKQQEWQKHVALNHHSWEVQSLRDAGLNPLLSATGGAGSSFSGSSPSFSGGSGAGGRSNLDPVDDVASVLAIVKGIEEISKLKKEVKKTDAEIKNIDAQTEGQRLHNEHRRLHPSSGDHYYNRLMNNLNEAANFILDPIVSGDGEWHLDKVFNSSGKKLNKFFDFGVKSYANFGKLFYNFLFNSFGKLFK